MKPTILYPPPLTFLIPFFKTYLLEQFGLDVWIGDDFPPDEIAPDLWVAIRDDGAAGETLHIQRRLIAVNSSVSEREDGNYLSDVLAETICAGLRALPESGAPVCDVTSITGPQRVADPTYPNLRYTTAVLKILGDIPTF